MKRLGRILLGGLYLAVPIFGWVALWRSFKQVKANEITLLQNFGGSIELLDREGIYFRPFPGDTFQSTYQKTQDYIDFGPIKRVRIKANDIAYKTLANGQMERLIPGIHFINTGNNEVFDPATDVKKLTDDFIEIGYLKIVRIKEGQLGVKIDRNGHFVPLNPGIHEINAQQGETFTLQNGIQEVGKDDYTLGYTRFVTIRNGELGESYKNGIFCLLEPGRHALQPGHNFVKRVSVENDVVDLGAYKIITVKEGQVVVINTREGVVTKGPGKHEVKQEEGNFFNAIITTSPQGVNLPSLTVMCSDQIEMRADAMLIYKVTDPLKTVGLGVNKIVEYLKTFADGTLRTILSRFSSADIAPSLHIDEGHDSSRRTEKLGQIHDALVKSLDEKAKEWGLCVSDLQITQILPADELYHKTVRELGSKQSTAEANKRIAENEAKILSIQAQGEQAKVIAAEIAQKEAIIRAETSAKIRGIETGAAANQTLAAAEAQAKAITLLANAESSRIRMMGEAAKDAPEVTRQVLLTEAQGKVLERVKNPVFVQPGLGDTTVLTRENNGITMFSTAQNGKRGSSNQTLTGINALQKASQTSLSLGGVQ